MGHNVKKICGANMLHPWCLTKMTEWSRLQYFADRPSLLVCSAPLALAATGPLQFECLEPLVMTWVTSFSRCLSFLLVKVGFVFFFLYFNHQAKHVPEISIFWDKSSITILDLTTRAKAKPFCFVGKVVHLAPSVIAI